MTLKDLIGYQLISIDDIKIVVRKGNSTYELLIDEDYGGCCGYNELNTKLFMSEDELARNPIITNVSMKDTDDECGNGAKITFYGEAKALAELNSYSSSGSGWCYGACVTVKCKALDMDEIITSW